MKMENIDINKEAHLQALRNQLAEQKAGMEAAKQAAAQAQRDAARAERLISMIERQIDATERGRPAPGMPTVSDHALVRYLERAHGIDVDAIKGEMLDAKTCASIRFLNGAAAKINANGLVYVVDNGVVITVYGNGDAQA